MVHALGRAHSTCSDSREGDVSGCPGDVGANSQGGARERVTGGSAAGAGERFADESDGGGCWQEGGSSLIAGNGRLGVVVVADGH